MAKQCTHTNQMKIQNTDTHVCEDCIKTGDTWVHLRLCLSCGHVGCCDSSKNKHATKHYQSTQHPLVRSIEPGESWVWCYVDEVYPGDLAATLLRQVLSYDVGSITLFAKGGGYRRRAGFRSWKSYARLRNVHQV